MGDGGLGGGGGGWMAKMGGGNGSAATPSSPAWNFCAYIYASAPCFVLRVHFVVTSMQVVAPCLTDAQSLLQPASSRLKGVASCVVKCPRCGHFFI